MLYQIPNASDPRNNFFRANVWHHLELAIASDRPEASAIIVDGVIGQDITKTPLPQHGRCSATTARCRALALAERRSPSRWSPPGGPTALGGPIRCRRMPRRARIGIAVKPLTFTVANKTLYADDLLPARGMVRIDDEYFLYDSIAPDHKTLWGYKGAEQIRPAAWPPPGHQCHRLPGPRPLRPSRPALPG